MASSGIYKRHTNNKVLRRMNQLNNLQLKFPVVDSIPESVRLPSQIHQRVSLVDGELKLWAGATKKTLSPIWIDRKSVV